MSDPKTDSILDEANRLFLRRRFADAIRYYDIILAENPAHLGSLNNKGYAQSKLGDFEGALKCYDAALEAHPGDLSVLINKISSLRKMKRLQESLVLCDGILEENPDYNAVLYHKERILFSMKRYGESVLCCNRILKDYPANPDVLYDKACGLVMKSDVSGSLEALGAAIAQNRALGAKASKSKCFESLRDNAEFLRMTG